MRKAALTGLLPVLHTLASLLLMVSFSVAQGSRVTVRRMNDKELRRTAYRLRLCVEDLKNARQALELLPELETERPNYWTRAQLAGNLLNAGQENEARALIDETLSIFAQDSVTEQALNEYANFAGQMAYYFPERLKDAVEYLEQAALQLQIADPQQRELSISDNRTLEVTAAEQVILSMVQRLLGYQPQTALHLLETFPEIQSKLESLGGLDGFLAPRHDRGRNQIATVKKLRGMNPNRIRLELSAARSVEDLQYLFTMSTELCEADPDASTVVLEKAAENILRTEEHVLEATQWFHQLIRMDLRCQGEVSPQLLNKGQAVLGQLHSQIEQLENNGSHEWAKAQAEHLEATLIASPGVSNFGQAMQMIRALEDDTQRFRALLELVSVLVDH